MPRRSTRELAVEVALRGGVTLMVVLVLIVRIASASAADLYATGNDYLGSCEQAASEVARVGCWSYVHGALDVISSPAYSGGAICMPRVTVRQVSDILIEELLEHPEDRHNPTTGILAAMLWHKFPCSH
jgi:hypothetical protein